MDNPSDDSIPIEMFDPKNMAVCKFCSVTFYWIWFPKVKRWVPYEIQTRKPHPRCIEKSNLRIYKLP